jgi:hypothetical protein
LDARGLGARLHRGRGSGALGLERLVLGLAMGGLGGGDLGLIRAHVRGERGARRVYVRLEAVVGVVGEEVSVATGVDAQHYAIGHAELSLELYAHVHLLVVVLGG